MTDYKDISPKDGEIYQRLLLQQILTEIGEMRSEQVNQGKDIARLNVKAGIWGTLGGAVVSTIYIFGAWVKGTVNG